MKQHFPNGPTMMQSVRTSMDQIKRDTGLSNRAFLMVLVFSATLSAAVLTFLDPVEGQQWRSVFRFIGWYMLGVSLFSVIMVSKVLSKQID